MNKLALSCLSYVSLVSTCCLPDRWQGMEIYLIGSIYNGSTVMTKGNVNASFDSHLQTIAYNFYESSSRGYFSSGFVLKDYKSKTEYSIAGGHCSKSEIVDPFPSNCIPSNATVEVKSFVMAGTQASVTRYSIPFIMPAYVTVTDKDCTPISYQTYGLIEGAESLKTSDIYGFTEGIKNPAVFDVPAICKKDRHA